MTTADLRSTAMNGSMRVAICSLPVDVSAMTSHEGPCCPFCDSEYLTKELQHPVCCHRQLIEEFEDDDTYRA
jgi:hypothetical protein